MVSVTASHDSSHGKRGRHIKTTVPFTGGKGYNWMAWAEGVVGRGKALEAFTADEHRDALRLAKMALVDLGEWPRRMSDERKPDHICKFGHQFPANGSCEPCKQRDRQRARRKRAA